MHSQKLDRPRPELTAPELRLQIPLEIPDHRRRPKIKPRPVRATIYFGGESALPVVVRPVKK